MKKIFLSLFVAGAISFGLQSCSEEDPCDDVTCSAGQICDDGTCVADPNSGCDECGTYNGDLNGNVDIVGITVPPLEDIPTSVVISTSNALYTIEVDLSDAIVPGLTPTATGTFDASTKTITFDDSEYSFDISGNGTSILEFLINGTAVFDNAGELTVNITLDSPVGAQNEASGTINVVANK